MENNQFLDPNIKFESSGEGDEKTTFSDYIRNSTILAFKSTLAELTDRWRQIITMTYEMRAKKHPDLYPPLKIESAYGVDTVSGGEKTKIFEIIMKYFTAQESHKVIASEKYYKTLQVNQLFACEFLKDIIAMSIHQFAIQKSMKDNFAILPSTTLLEHPLLPQVWGGFPMIYSLLYDGNKVNRPYEITDKELLEIIQATLANENKLFKEKVNSPEAKEIKQAIGTEKDLKVNQKIIKKTGTFLWRQLSLIVIFSRGKWSIDLKWDGTGKKAKNYTLHQLGFAPKVATKEPYKRFEMLRKFAEGGGFYDYDKEEIPLENRNSKGEKLRQDISRLRKHLIHLFSIDNDPIKYIYSQNAYSLQIKECRLKIVKSEEHSADDFRDYPREDDAIHSQYRKGFNASEEFQSSRYDRTCYTEDPEDS